MWLFLLFVLILGGVIAFYANRFNGRKKAFASFLAENPDFQPDYTYHTVLSIDVKTKRLSLSSNDSKFRIVSVLDIPSMRKEVNSNQPQIVFVIKDVECPQIRVPFISVDDRDLWYDRIVALCRITPA